MENKTCRGQTFQREPHDKCGTNEWYLFSDGHYECSHCNRQYAQSRYKSGIDKESIKRSTKKRNDIRNYGVTFDKKKTELRRAIEDRELNRLLSDDVTM